MQHRLSAHCSPLRGRTFHYAAFVALAFCIAFPSAAEESPPAFYFGGKPIFVGMSKAEALTALVSCCRVSPPPESGKEKQSSVAGQRAGHFIFSTETQPQRLLGTIFFADGKVIRISRPLAENVDAEDPSVVGFARALDRALSPTSGDADTFVRISVQHLRMSNAEEETLLLSFPNGKGVEIQVFTLDAPSKITGKRDSVSMDETLAAPWQR